MFGGSLAQNSSMSDMAIYQQSRLITRTSDELCHSEDRSSIIRPRNLSFVIWVCPQFVGHSKVVDLQSMILPMLRDGLDAVIDVSGHW